ncbi:MAG: hypothetical protein ACJA0N_000003 [Pseudohongiellaceae bacterium]|jgi:hypothetical protein
MKKENYKKIMSCLDVIETELNKVAKSVGHVSFEEFTSKDQKKSLSQAA